MKKIIVLRGLPRSGKSTFAIEFIKNNPDYVRVNRDSLRKMLGKPAGSRDEKYEKKIIELETLTIKTLLSSDFNVIVDDINLSEKNISRLKVNFSKIADIEINDSFLSVPFDEIIRRNNNSPKDEKVPEKTLTELYEQFVSSTGLSKEERQKVWLQKSIKTVKREYVPYDKNLPDCLVFDIDGTLALMNGRQPFNWKKVGEDLPNVPVINILENFFELSDVRYREGNKDLLIFIVSARDSVCRKETINWLNTYNILYNDLFMRPEGDSRKDSVIKEEIYHNRFEGKYNVLAVFDDRNQTVEKWRELGLLCLQVADGNF